jgi:hypothetical protein
MDTRLSLLAIGLGITLAGGCAEMHTGAFAVPVDPAGRIAPTARLRSSLRISSRQVADLSSRYFGAIEVTFENTSADWVRIQAAGLDFGTPARNAAMSIPAGEDLMRWQEGTQRRNAIRAANEETALDLLLFGAFTVSAAAGRSPVGAGAAVVGAGTALAMGGRALDERVSAAEGVALYPITHLLAVPFSVPPGLAIKRWIVLHSRGSASPGCIRHADLHFTTDTNLAERVRIAFNNSNSEWQRPICNPLGD